MTKQRFSVAVLAVVLAATAAGCADHPAASAPSRDRPGAAPASPPPAAQMTRYGVSRDVLAAASNLGYSPKIVNGQTVFCKEEDETGSFISQDRCVDANALRAEVLQQRQVRDRLQRTSPSY